MRAVPSRRRLVALLAPFGLALLLAAPACSQTFVPPPEPAPGAPAAAPGEFSHDLFGAVLRERVAKGEVDYVALRDDERFREVLRRLAVADPAKMASTSEKLAFWINAYNAVTLYGILSQLDVKDAAKVAAWRTNHGLGQFFKGYSYRVAGRDLTLDAIEHEIVRKEFREPRVHFALVCASKGCPPLRSEAFRGADLERQLEEQTKSFLADPSKNAYDPKTKTLTLSPLFDWFAGDFDAAGGRLEFVRRRLPRVPADARIEFGEYDWSLNARPLPEAER